MNTRNWILALSGATMLAACAEKDVILPGQREDLRAEDTVADVVNERRAISVPAQTRNSSWTHRIGTQAFRVSNASLSTFPQLAWSAGIGEGNSRKNRMSADPVAADGLIYTIDSQAKLQATASNGGVVWTRDLTPPRDDSEDALGGGLAYGSGKLFVATGFGSMVALNPKTGAVLWEQELGGIGSGSPTVFGDLVYIVSGDDNGWALEVETGRIAWQLSSVPNVNNIMSAAAPALNDRFAIFPFGSGELQATFRNGGFRVWDAGISGERPGRARSKIGDISGDPVIEGSKVYAANHSGRIVALNIESGERLWTATEGALGPVWPVGGSVFMVNDRNKLLRLDSKDGSVIWSVDLPKFVESRPTRQAALYAHYGPVLAGGRLVVASSDGLLRIFDPASGAQVHAVEIPGGAASSPIVMNGTLYVVGGKGNLHAFR
ncbi:PQQ-like beta-propeller repeat protein [Shimia thalassica]|uniref:PQQ-like beta-propeller repeat protein n=1 Tax=Shimia thalassica TaxID=1715693 RepID=UPI0027337ED5|nr:PQQ-like beta-propeller repeat protein [Shimia thalassica]MDP2518803.1 PQQ-binding-like beta-propeller repeat protein [Shimia thalassica]